jgi:ABC-type glycerol-3-phosphate transport system permease component
MLKPVAVIVVSVFTALSLVHFYWALGGSAGKSAAIPEVSGRRAFVPSSAATLAVASGLTLCALLVAATAGFVRILFRPPGSSGLAMFWRSFCLRAPSAIFDW